VNLFSYRNIKEVNGLFYWYELLAISDSALKLGYDSENRFSVRDVSILRNICLKLQKGDKGDGTCQKRRKL